MNALSSVALISFLLFVLLLFVWSRAALASRDSPSHLEPLLEEDSEIPEVCAPEYVRKIFSRTDWEFILQMRSPRLRQLFLRERKAVALYWVQQTSRAIRRILREHAAASRRSRDLELAREAKIFLQYAELRVVCGLLYISIGLAGPQRLSGLAFYAEELLQRIGRARQVFEAAAAPREVRNLGRL
jgi:hypothetical protein